MNFRIEPLEKKHIASLAKLEGFCFPHHPWSELAFREEFENPLAVYFGAFCEQELVGYGGLWRIVDEGHITNIGVHPDFRRQGLGGLLLERFLRYMLDEKLSFLTLEVRLSNEPARKLYEKYGFREVGIRPKYYQNQEDAVLYRLERKDGL